MFAGCLVAAIVALAGAGAEAQDAPPTTMIVLDGSGSMWGNLGTE
jgi:hypothetical protein